MEESIVWTSIQILQISKTNENRQLSSYLYPLAQESRVKFQNQRPERGSHHSFPRLLNLQKNRQPETCINTTATLFVTIFGHPCKQPCNSFRSTKSFAAITAVSWDSYIIQKLEQWGNILLFASMIIECTLPAILVRKIYRKISPRSL